MAYKDKNDPRLKEARDKWYRNNKKKQLKNQKETTRHKREFLKRWKGTKSCEDCGISFRNRAWLCDLHHLEDKKDNVSMLVSHSMKTLKVEIRKCVPLCANCHRGRHYNNTYTSA